MGCTAVDIQLLGDIIKWHRPKSVVELGAQNRYDQPHLPAPYMREWYEARGIKYESIDLTRECGAVPIDLGKDFPVWPEHDFLLTDIDGKPQFPEPFDMLTDLGTSEHVSDDGNSYGTGHFSWEAIYNCWYLKHALLKIGGIMFNENPKTGNWPGHSFQYYTQEFYYEFCKMAGYVIIQAGEIPAMGNVTDGWNILCILKKVSDKFPELEQFKTLDLRQK